MKKINLFVLLFLSVIVSAIETKNIPYYEPSNDDYRNSQCRLDIAYNPKKIGFATIVWFHGGGLTGGKRYIPDLLQTDEIAVVPVSYRLSPKVKAPVCIEDAAAAVAWVIKNIEKYGGDPKKVYIAGHSAGGYLAGMIGFDPRYLAKFDVANCDLAGLMLVSAQVTTHFRIRADLGDETNQYLPKIDQYSVLAHAGHKVVPTLLVVGERRIEWKARVEENFFLKATMQALGNKKVECYEMGGLNHGEVRHAAVTLMKKFVNKKK